MCIASHNPSGCAKQCKALLCTGMNPHACGASTTQGLRAEQFRVRIHFRACFAPSRICYLCLLACFAKATQPVLAKHARDVLANSCAKEPFARAWCFLGTQFQPLLCIARVTILLLRVSVKGEISTLALVFLLWDGIAEWFLSKV